MPFIMTTTRRGYGLAPERGPRTFVSQVAVGSLDEARALLYAAAKEQRYVILPDDRSPFTLPDGTIIEVEPTTWQDLGLAAGLTFPASVGNRAEVGDEKPRRELLDAFNAQEAKQ